MEEKGDGLIAPMDALRIVNLLLDQGVPADQVKRYLDFLFDTVGDDSATPEDVDRFFDRDESGKYKSPEAFVRALIRAADQWEVIRNDKEIKAAITPAYRDITDISSAQALSTFKIGQETVQGKLLLDLLFQFTSETRPSFGISEEAWQGHDNAALIYGVTPIPINKRNPAEIRAFFLH